MSDCRTEYLVTRNKQFLCMTIFFFFYQVTNCKCSRFWGDLQAAVSLTFDDGIQEHYTLVPPPHLNRYALRGTFGINGKYMGDIDDHLLLDSLP